MTGSPNKQRMKIKLIMLSILVIALSLPIGFLILNMSDHQQLWSQRGGGLFGGIVGTGCGILGGVIGGLSACYRRKWAFTLQFILLLLMGLAGSVMLIVGIIFVANGQPYHVWYPLVLAGGIMGILGFAMLRIPGMRRQMIENARIKALDSQG